jgi:hypothetical protein
MLRAIHCCPRDVIVQSRICHRRVIANAQQHDCAGQGHLSADPRLRLRSRLDPCRATCRLVSTVRPCICTVRFSLFRFALRLGCPSDFRRASANGSFLLGALTGDREPCPLPSAPLAAPRHRIGQSTVVTLRRCAKPCGRSVSEEVLPSACEVDTRRLIVPLAGSSARDGTRRSPNEPGS